MPDQELISYPRKRIARTLMKGAGRLLIPLLFNVRINGKDNFPEDGPLIVVGNHTAAMEAVLMNIYTPWQIEMLSSADIPAEKITEWISRWYGVIPLKRGSYDREALRTALAVLDQGGRIGIFPEGGIWARGRMNVQRGAAWLSYRGKAPVLPIGFNDTTGALGKALDLKRPELDMVVGKIIPPVNMDQEKPRKVILGKYAERVMAAVRELIPEAKAPDRTAALDETFSLEIHVLEGEGRETGVPPGKEIQHPSMLARFLHNPAVLKIFRVNLDYPVQPLENLHATPDPEQLLEALDPILTYLREENPYLLTYRFGTGPGLEMEQGLIELYNLILWVQQQNYSVKIVPIREYYSPQEKHAVIQKKQGSFQSWM